MTDNEGFFNAATDSTTRTSGSSSAYDFVKGFITGQVALLSLLVFIVRFLFFRSTGSAASGGSLIRIDALAFSGRKGRKSVRHSPPVSPSFIHPSLSRSL